MYCDSEHREGWYHNGSETRRFSDTLPYQKLAFHGLKSTLLERNEPHDGELRGYHRIKAFGVDWTFADIPLPLPHLSLDSLPICLFRYQAP